MSDKVMGISNEAVVKATGSGWDEWFALLDEAGAQSWDHKQMVAFVAEQGLDKAWWQQMVTSSYERARGLKEVGETSDAAFQIGVQRTIGAPREVLWELLLSPKGRAVWLGEVDTLPLEPGARYQTRRGVTGEIRTFREGERIRLTWQPPELDRATTLQVTLSCPRNTDSKTTLRFHHEKLESAEHREEMRAHWKAVAQRLRRLAAEG
jgi:uncharacterized protein YndB with AHSA1/START domain